MSYRDKAEQLHAELEKHPGTEDLRKEIKAVLVRPEHGPTLRDRLREFAAQHPKLAGALQGLIDELNAAGL
ncbi:MAG: hypothetical protein JO257_25595 [Deltaproteobacteria bacterium]|nr:hypothetical protein [Deltaproteobacteria bacterium]